MTHVMTRVIASSTFVVTERVVGSYTSMNSTCFRPTNAGARPAKSVASRTFVVSAFALTTAAAIAGCGTAGTTSTDKSTPVSAAVKATPTETAAQVVVSPGQAATSRPAADVSGAEKSALALFVRLRLNASDPSQGYVWTSGPASRTHLSLAVKARLAELSAQAYFSDGPGGCGEDYITATQNGLFTAPSVLSGTENSDGSVTVVMKRPGGPTNLTAVMTKYDHEWLASDLQSGSGPAASIFSAKPNC